MFTGPPPAYQTIWLIGNDFVTDSVGEHFQSSWEDGKPYMRDKYNVQVHNSSQFSLTTSLTVRLHNNLVKALNENVIFPKAIVFVLDGDLIKTIAFNNYGLSEIYGQIMKNLMVGIHRIILAHKEKLPQKSKIANYPTVLWVLPPQHINFPANWNNKCRKLGNCIESLVALFPEMDTLKM